MRGFICIAILGTMKFYNITQVFDLAQSIFFMIFFIVAIFQDIKEASE